MRAGVSMPRSPTTTSERAKTSRSRVGMVVNAAGSPVLPGNTRTATGRPKASVSSP